VLHEILEALQANPVRHPKRRNASYSARITPRQSRLTRIGLI